MQALDEEGTTGPTKVLPAKPSRLKLKDADSPVSRRDLNSGWPCELDVVLIRLQSVSRVLGLRKCGGQSAGQVEGTSLQLPKIAPSAHQYVLFLNTYWISLYFHHFFCTILVPELGDDDAW